MTNYTAFVDTILANDNQLNATLPTHAVGDTLILVVANGSGTNATTSLAGWSLEEEQVQSTNSRLSVFSRIADGTEAGVAPLQFSGFTSAAVRVFAYPAGTLVEAVNKIANYYSADVTCPVVTTTSTDTQIMRLMSFRGSTADFTAPPTAMANVTSGLLDIAIGLQAQALAGVSSSEVFTHIGSSHGALITVALKAPGAANLSTPRTDTNGTSLLVDVSSGAWAGSILVDPSKVTVSGTTESYTGTTLGTTTREYAVGHKASYSAGTLTLDLRDAIYADDVSLTVVFADDAITDGTDTNAALSSTAITNNSTLVYTKVSTRFAGATIDETTAFIHHDVVDTDLYIEALADHASGVAAVHFEVTDGVTPQTFIATAETNSKYRDSVLIDSATFTKNSGGIGVFSSDLIDLSLLNDGLLDVTITAYPKYGDAGSVRVDTAKLYNNAGGTIAATTEIWADSVSGNDTTGDGSFGNPYATLNKAGDEAAKLGSSGAAPSTFNTELVTVRLKAGSYTLARFGSPYWNSDYPLIVDKDPAATRDQVVIRSITAGGEQMRVRYLQFREVTLDISNGSTGSNVLFSNQETTIYPDATNPAHLMFKGTKFTHALGREGQLASSSNFWATTFKGNSVVWLLGTTINDMNQDGLISNPQQVYARNTLIQGVSSDMIKQLSLFTGFVAKDNLTPNSYLQGVLVSGAFTAGDTIRDPISGKTAVVASYDAGNALIYLTLPVVSGDFKQADQVAGGIVNDTQTGTFTYQAVHPDGAQFANDVGEKNAIVCNGWFKDCDGQMLFCEEGTTSPTKGLAFYNIIAEHTDGTSNFISQTDSLEGLTFSYLTLPNQDLQINEDATTNVSVKYVVVKSFNVDDRGHPGISFEGVHKQEVGGFNSLNDSLATTGSAGFVSGLGFEDVYSDISQDYTPDTGSPLLSRIPAGKQLHGFDIFGYARLDDGTGAIGAVEQSTGLGTIYNEGVQVSGQINYTQAAEFVLNETISVSGQSSTGEGTQTDLAETLSLALNAAYQAETGETYSEAVGFAGQGLVDLNLYNNYIELSAEFQGFAGIQIASGCIYNPSIGFLMKNKLSGYTPRWGRETPPENSVWTPVEPKL